MLIPFLLLCGVLLILIYRLYVIEQNFASYIDFSDTKISELEAKAAQLDAFDTQIYDLISTDLYRVVKYLQYQIDLIKLSYEMHNLSYYHLGEDHTPVKVKPPLEEEFKLHELEIQILKAAEELGIRGTLKSNRSRGLNDN